MTLILVLACLLAAVIMALRGKSGVVVVEPLPGTPPEGGRKPVLDPGDLERRLEDGRLEESIRLASDEWGPARRAGEIESLVRQEKFLEAIALYRKVHGTDLATAKKAIDKMMLRR